MIKKAFSMLRGIHFHLENRSYALLMVALWLVPGVGMSAPEPSWDAVALGLAGQTSPARPPGSVEVAIQNVLRDLKAAQTGELAAKDPLGYAPTLSAAFNRLESALSNAAKLGKASDTDAAVWAEETRSGFPKQSLPEFSFLASVVEETKKLAILQPRWSELLGTKLRALLLATGELYGRDEIADFKRRLVEWDDGYLTAAALFARAEERFDREIRPLLDWPDVIIDDLDEALAEQEKDLRECLGYLHCDYNVPKVYETRSDQLNEVGVALVGKHPSRGMEHRAKSCLLLAAGIQRVAKGSDFSDRGRWIQGAQNKLFERAADVARHDMFPRGSYTELITFGTTLVEEYPESLSPLNRARLLIYVAQCYCVQGNERLAAHFFNRANALSPGVATRQVFEDVGGCRQQ